MFVTITRATAVCTILALAAYVTGLQKLVLDPVLGWFRGLPPAAQLAVIALIVAGFVVLGILRSRRRRAQIDRASRQVGTFGSAPPAPTPAPPSLPLVRAVPPAR